MGRDEIGWLHSELPRLVREGVLDEGSAERLRRHYAISGGAKGWTPALTIFAVLGGLLIGSGIILVLAHNWNGFPRWLRATMALGLLGTAQGLTALALIRKAGSAAWREGTAAFQMSAIGACMALIGQTYHLGQPPEDFLLWWLLLSLPLAYLTDSATVVVMYLAGALAWAGYLQMEGFETLQLWGLAALAAPFYYSLLTRRQPSRRAIVLLPAASIFLAVAGGFTLSEGVPGLWIILYSSLFSLYLLAGRAVSARQDVSGTHSLSISGFFGITGLAFILTFDGPWRGVAESSQSGSQANLPDFLIVFFFLLATLALFVKTGSILGPVFTSFACIALLAPLTYMVVVLLDSVAVGVIVFNLYTLLLGIMALNRGMATQRIETLNSGLLIIGVLVGARFFHSNLDLLVRGTAFIIIGIGFLTANLLWYRRSRSRLRHDL